MKMGCSGVEQVPDEALLVVFAGLSPRALLTCEGAGASRACASPPASQSCCCKSCVQREAFTTCLS